METPYFAGIIAMFILFIALFINGGMYNPDGTKSNAGLGLFYLFFATAGYFSIMAYGISRMDEKNDC